MVPHEILQQWWSETKADIPTRPTPEAEIEALEARYDIQIPADFRDYLSQAVPAAENWDERDGNWWPLGRIKNIPEEYEHAVGEIIECNAAKHLFFVDFSIWSWAWAISCAGDETHGKIAFIGGGESDCYVAESFADFVDRYTNDWWSLVTDAPYTKRGGVIGRFRAWLARL